MCISQSVLERTNRIGVCVYVLTERYHFKELAHAIVGVGKFKVHRTEAGNSGRS